jgi:hypothetical protein
MQDVERELGLDREALVRLALLLGSDYTEGCQGGPGDGRGPAGAGSGGGERARSCARAPAPCTPVRALSGTRCWPPPTRQALASSTRWRWCRRSRAWTA